MAIKNEILTITDPAIDWLDEMRITDIESPGNTDGVVPSKFAGYVVPFITINGFEVSAANLVSFRLDTNTYLPSVLITMIDTHDIFMSQHYPTDGDVISVLIRANNEEIFKPIRIDFDILTVDPSAIIDNQPKKITISGQMKVPYLLTEFCEAFSKQSSLDTLNNMADKLKLGFASNESETNDIMTWINPYDTSLKFIEDTVCKAYKDDNSFFTSFIDPYYYLNFVNVNTLFGDSDEVDMGEIYPVNDPAVTDDPDQEQIKTEGPQLLSNHLAFKGTSKYIKYKLFNNSGKIFLSNGYKRYAQFFSIEDNEYISEYVDPLTTDGSDDMLHTKGRMIIKDDTVVPEGIADNHVKYKYLGKQYSDEENGNVHENFMYSDILNKQNITEMFKVGMIADLDIIDMTFRKYQQVYVDINDYDIMNIESASGNHKDTPIRQNKYLSGHYIITGIKYNYKYPGPITQQITMVKREFNIPEE